MIYAYIIIIALGVCFVAALIYVYRLKGRIANLIAQIEWLDARTKPATEMIAIRHSIDTYAMAKQYRFDYLNQILEVMIRKLANEITRRLHDRLYTELRKRILSHKEIFFCSPINLEYLMDISIPVYRVDWETIYLNGERVNELDHDRRDR